MNKIKLKKNKNLISNNKKKAKRKKEKRRKKARKKTKQKINPLQKMHKKIFQKVKFRNSLKKL